MFLVTCVGISCEGGLYKYLYFFIYFYLFIEEWSVRNKSRNQFFLMSICVYYISSMKFFLGIYRL